MFILHYMSWRYLVFVVTIKNISLSNHSLVIKYSYFAVCKQRSKCPAHAQTIDGHVTPVADSFIRCVYLSDRKT